MRKPPDNSYSPRLQQVAPLPDSTNLICARPRRIVDLSRKEITGDAAPMSRQSLQTPITPAPDANGSASRHTPQVVPPTKRQLLYARRIATSAGIVLPWSVQQDRASLSQWISNNAHRIQRTRPASRAAAPDDRPSSRQVAWAERIARARRRQIPDECYRSRSLMRGWIDSNTW